MTVGVDGLRRQPHMISEARMISPMCGKRWLYWIGAIALIVLIGAAAAAWWVRASPRLNSDEAKIVGTWSLRGVPGYQLTLEANRSFVITHDKLPHIEGRWKYEDDRLRYMHDLPLPLRLDVALGHAPEPWFDMGLTYRDDDVLEGGPMIYWQADGVERTGGPMIYTRVESP